MLLVFSFFLQTVCCWILDFRLQSILRTPRPYWRSYRRHRVSRRYVRYFLFLSADCLRLFLSFVGFITVALNRRKFGYFFSLIILLCSVCFVGNGARSATTRHVPISDVLDITHSYRWIEALVSKHTPEPKRPPGLIPFWLFESLWFIFDLISVAYLPLGPLKTGPPTDKPLVVVSARLSLVDGKGWSISRDAPGLLLSQLMV